MNVNIYYGPANDLRRSGSSGLEKQVLVLEEDENPCLTTLSNTSIIGVNPYGGTISVKRGELAIAYMQERWGECSRIDPCAQPLTEGATPGSPVSVLWNQYNTRVRIASVLQLYSRWRTPTSPVLQLRVYHQPHVRKAEKVTHPTPQAYCSPRLSR